MIRLSRSVVGQSEIDAAAFVLTRGFLGMGEEVRDFENELRTYLNADAVACVSTGTAALQLALQAIGVGPGDEVLLPTLTYVASFQAVSATGATPVACDVREADGLLDLADAERRVTSRTRAVMPVHYASYPGDLDAVYAFARSHGLRVVEDAAHAFGCTHRGRRIGSFGDIVCFSFDGIKNITSGEGGAVVSADPAVMDKVRDARLLGVQHDTEKRYRGERSWDFDVTEQGWRYHMSDIMAAIGRVQLRRFEAEFAPRRIGLAKAYRQGLAGVAGLKLFANDGEGVVPHIFPLRVLDGRRDMLRSALEQAGIQSGIHYKPNHLLTRFGGGAPKLPVAEELYGELLTLPLHPQVAAADCEQVLAVVRDTLRKQAAR